MSAETNPKPKARRVPPKLIDDGFVWYDVDGFAQLTPEQKLWPVDDPIPGPDDAEPDVPPVNAPGTPPSPPG